MLSHKGEKVIRRHQHRADVALFALHPRRLSQPAFGTIVAQSPLAGALSTSAMTWPH